MAVSAWLCASAFVVAAPGDLDIAGFNAADPVVTHRGKALARPGRSNAAVDNGRGVARQADGKLLVAGSCSGLLTSKLCVVRFNANGTPDLTFNPDATQGGTQPDLQAGELIIEITPSQSLFGMVAVQADQKIIVGGTCSNLTSGYFDFCLVRLHPDASIDTSFNAAGVTPGVATVAPGNFFNVARGLMLQPDGKIVLVGSCGATIVATAMCISRHNANGTLDTSFNPSGAVPGTRIETIGNSNDSYAMSAARQSDGKLVVAGTCVNNSNSEFCLIRFSDMGALDTTSFGPAAPAAKSSPRSTPMRTPQRRWRSSPTAKSWSRAHVRRAARLAATARQRFASRATTRMAPSTRRVSTQRHRWWRIAASKCLRSTRITTA